MHVELVRTVTRDGLRLDGALARESGVGGRESASAAILLHGVASNFYTSSTFEPLIPRLQGLGLAVLSVNTRGHDSVFGAGLGTVRRRFGAAYEIVDECRQDIGAWIEFLRSRGHQQIALIGHSLGAVKAVYFQAHEKCVDVAAVVAVSPPRLSYSAFMNAPESTQFWDSMHTAEEMAKGGQGEELFTSKFPFPMLMTAAAYMDKYGPTERYNILKFVADLPCPALFTYGSKEVDSGGVAFAGMPEAVSSLPNGERRSVRVIDGGDHVYSGVTPQLAEQISDWLSGNRFAPD
jgi:pimeloyl-ACP methyl ester carboxylesterase